MKCINTEELHSPWMPNNLIGYVFRYTESTFNSEKMTLKTIPKLTEKSLK